MQLDAVTFWPWGNAKTPANAHVPVHGSLVYLELIANVGRVLAALPCMPCRLHIRRHGGVVLRDPALFISSKSITSQIGIRRVEGVAYPFRKLRSSLATQRSASVVAPVGGQERGKDESSPLTLTSPHTNDSGRPYLSTVSTKTLSANTCIQAMTASPHAVLPSLNASFHTFSSFFPSFSTSFCSSSLPPSLYL